jgi:hypothetical protein
MNLGSYRLRFSAAVRHDAQYSAPAIHPGYQKFNICNKFIIVFAPRQWQRFCLTALHAA